jgi:hypothetical protein
VKCWKDYSWADYSNPFVTTTAVSSVVCGRSLAGIVGSNPAWPWCLSHVNVEFYKVKVSGQGWSIVQRSHIQCGVIVKPQEVAPAHRGVFCRGKKFHKRFLVISIVYEFLNPLRTF